MSAVHQPGCRCLDTCCTSAAGPPAPRARLWNTPPPPAPMQFFSYSPPAGVQLPTANLKSLPDLQDLVCATAGSRRILGRRIPVFLNHAVVDPHHVEPIGWIRFVWIVRILLHTLEHEEHV